MVKSSVGLVYWPGTSKPTAIYSLSWLASTAALMRAIGPPSSRGLLVSFTTVPPAIPCYPLAFSGQIAESVCCRPPCTGPGYFSHEASLSPGRLYCR
ncbi:hypothetical protein BCR43DRAFT_103465 [Syncephalastrum racemosum]|uniref:Uncharacterized protein n=1 Tax=Syncephalastrum racemosum TaxID=13706 RepID=A0A1X2H1Q6_SYNRA|nr:hypothetical protein BCR43DRAFT_103465 [Syncephalastrum racemosum]